MRQARMASRAVAVRFRYVIVILEALPDSVWPHATIEKALRGGENLKISARV